MIPVSPLSKCHNCIASTFLLFVPAKTTKSSSLTNLHLQSRHRRLLLPHGQQASVSPAVFHQRNDERRRSTSFLAARGGGGGSGDGWDLDVNHSDVHRDGVSINGIVSHSRLTNGGGGGSDFCVDDARIVQQRPWSSSTRDSEDSASSKSSSHRPNEKGGGEETGIEGILSRLEKERNSLYSVESDKKENRRRPSEKTRNINERHAPTDAVARSESHSKSAKELPKSGDDPLQSRSFLYSSDSRSSCKPETWNMWSPQEADIHETEFEAEGIVASESGRLSTSDDSSARDVGADSESHALHKSLSEYEDSTHTNKGTEKFRSQIYAVIQQLQLELTSVLHILRSENNSIVSDKVERRSLGEMSKLSDAWEFQQIEIMKSKTQLRAAHAKLVVLERKMALEISEAQRMVKEKQKRIEKAQKALNMLRTTCIIWPTAASEVFLVGSFDGWVSQRRMGRSSSGIFSLNLKLYPGRYEIKFIVNGIWRIDPLRPVVHSSGYENNLLIIS